MLILMSALWSINTNAQITLEHNYSVPPGKMFYFTDLGNNNYKYVLIDYYNDKINLYNLDHTPYMLNIIPGIPLDSGVFDISYITTSLFDCDSTNIEYVEASNTNYRQNHIIFFEPMVLYYFQKIQHLALIA